ncbi:hypothetical protein RB601_007221 [Gaeumannomyces tritici]
MLWHLVSVLVLLLARGALAIDVKVVAAFRNGNTPVDPSKITLLRKELTPSQLERLNGTEAGGGGGGGGGKSSSSRRSNPIGYSGNWCGASQHTPTTNRFKSVSGVFNVPNLSLRPSTGTPQFVASWVGMDGANCATALVQAGATTEISSSSVQTSNLWFEWIPDAAYNIQSLPAHPDDMIRVTITATSSSQATILVENLSLAPTAPVTAVQVSLSNGSPLCRIDAEWIVENFKVNGNQTPFGRFQDVWFQTCEAKTTSGSTIGINGASMIYLQNNGPNPNCFAYEYSNSAFWTESS